MIPIPGSLKALPSSLASVPAGAWKEIGWVLAGQAAAVAGSLAALKALTTVLSPAVYGEVNLVVVTCTLPTLVLLAPLVQSCYRFYAEHDERGTLPALVGTTVALQAGVVVLVGLAAAIALLVGDTRRLGVPAPTVAWGYALFATDSGRNLCLTVAAAGRKRTVVAAGFAADAWLRPLGAVAFALIFGRGSAQVLAGFAAAGACSLVPLSIRLARETPGLRFERRVVGDVARYGLPYGLWGIFGWAQAGADRYMVDHWLTRADVGRYVAASQVGAFPFSIAGAFAGQLVSPILFQRAGDGTDPRRVESAKGLLLAVLGLFLVFGIAALVLLWFAGPALLRLLTGGREYAIPRAVLVTVAAAALLFQMAQVCSSMFLIRKRSAMVLWPKILGGITAVAAGLLVIPGRGLAGAALASLCASAALLAGHRLGPAGKAWRTRTAAPKLRTDETAADT